LAAQFCHWECCTSKGRRILRDPNAVANAHSGPASVITPILTTGVVDWRVQPISNRWANTNDTTIDKSTLTNSNVVMRFTPYTR
jgi:hypothetical protein